MKPTGYIYMLETEDWYYKIGLTRELNSRVRTLKIQLPYPASLKHAVPVLGNLRQAERYIHNHFDKYRMNGEWFDLPDKAVEWFCSLRYGDIDRMMNNWVVRREWVSWEYLCEVEPRLIALEKEARRIGLTNYEGYTDPFYRQIKRQLYYLVGFRAERDAPFLRSSAAYEVAYFHLLDLTLWAANQQEDEEW